jgi:hypothetical protein
MSTQTTTGTYDRSTRTYLFDLDIDLGQETMTWSGTIEELQAMVGPHGYYAFVCQSMSPPAILIGDGMLVNIPKERGRAHASYILLARANTLVREISSGVVTYTRTLREGERLIARRVLENRTIMGVNVGDAIERMINIGFSRETAIEIVLESGPDWLNVLSAVVSVISTEAKNNRQAVIDACEGAIRAHDQAIKGKVNAARAYLREQVGWTVETNETVMRYIRVMLVIARQEVLPGACWQETEAQPIEGAGMSGEPITA